LFASFSTSSAADHWPQDDSEFQQADEFRFLGCCLCVIGAIEVKTIGTAWQPIGDNLCDAPWAWLLAIHNSPLVTLALTPGFMPKDEASITFITFQGA
jgi:hypothetical protein